MSLENFSIFYKQEICDNHRKREKCLKREYFSIVKKFICFNQELSCTVNFLL